MPEPESEPAPDGPPQAPTPAAPQAPADPEPEPTRPDPDPAPAPDPVRDDEPDGVPSPAAAQPPDADDPHALLDAAEAGEATAADAPEGTTEDVPAHDGAAEVATVEAVTEDERTADGDAAGAEGDAAGADGDAAGAEGDAAGADGEAAGADGDAAGAESAPGGGRRGARKGRARPRGRGGRRRFAWDDVFLKQRLDLLRSMEVDAPAVGWAVGQAGPVLVAEILAGEGSSGREFGRRAFQARPETDDQAAWILLAAVRAREVLPAARFAVSTIEEPREQVAAAVAALGAAPVNAALKAEGNPQQVFAERAHRVAADDPKGAETRRAWALLALARPVEVTDAVSGGRRGGPGQGGPRQGGPGRGGPGHGGPGRGGPGRGDGPGGRGGDRGRGSGRGGPDGRREGGGRRRREPSIPGGTYNAGGASGIGGQLAEKLQRALAGEDPQRRGPRTPASDERPAAASGRRPSARERALQRLEAEPPPDDEG